MRADPSEQPEFLEGKAKNPDPSRPAPLPEDGRRRVVIAQVEPLVDAGRFAVKRCVGDSLRVRAQAFCDGHDLPSCALSWRHESGNAGGEKLMEDVGWDWWEAQILLPKLGQYHLEVRGWVDHFKTWRAALEKRLLAGQKDLAVELMIGVKMIETAAARARTGEALEAARRLEASARELGDEAYSATERGRMALESRLFEQMQRWAPRAYSTTARPALRVDVEPVRARFSSWYEFFPRSGATSTTSKGESETSRGESSPDLDASDESQPAAGDENAAGTHADSQPRHATLKDAISRLEYIAQMGFDVVYLPPIHPIGRVHRKGPNNATTGGPDDVGSPWAIGSDEGGHHAVHPALGTLDDFDALVRRARALDMEIAMDIAFQAAPDHPWVKAHPSWFRARPDGTIQYAENPPKKYEDIYPFDFESDEWRALWTALEGVVRHWCEHGVRVFRVDNPHTKPYALWEWLIGSIKASHPEVIFLAEAFSRPAVMHRLAKLGFSQSYTYFTWRNTRWELEEYLRELCEPPVVEFMRPNFWPNTPDILAEPLHAGRRSTFMLRVALAATMSSNYGIYGPAYELMEHIPREPGGEEYLDSEKYQLRAWKLDQPESLRDFIGRLNRIRRENPALQQMRHTTIHHADNGQILVFSKRSAARDNFILVVANLDPSQTQASMVNLNLGELGVSDEQPFWVHDLLDDARYQWEGNRNYIELNPHRSPVHIFRIGERRFGPGADERDFDYY